MSILDEDLFKETPRSVIKYSEQYKNAEHIADIISKNPFKYSSWGGIEVRYHRVCPSNNNTGLPSTSTTIDFNKQRDLFSIDRNYIIEQIMKEYGDILSSDYKGEVDVIIDKHFNRAYVPTYW